MLPDHSEICWKGKSYTLGDQGVTDINIKAELKAVHLRRLLYVVIKVETNRDPVSRHIEAQGHNQCIGFDRGSAQGLFARLAEFRVFLSGVPGLVQGYRLR